MAIAGLCSKRLALAAGWGGIVNRFALLHNQRGSITAKQESALVRLIASIGLDTFRVYRARLGIYAPLLRLSKQEASALIDAIVRDFEAGQ